jgi:serine protease Do
VAEVAREIEPSVVQVNVSSIQTSPYSPREARGLGSGVIYREDGYIVTNNHVVAGAETVNVAFADGSVEKGRVVGGDPYTDIAVVVRVERGNLPAAEFGDSRDLVVGQGGRRASSPRRVLVGSLTPSPSRSSTLRSCLPPYRLCSVNGL